MPMANQSETKVVLKGVHLCCDACVNGVGVALKGMEGVNARCDIGNRTVTLTANDDAAAQKPSMPWPPPATTATPAISNWR